jgi:uncharacterized membrane protein
MSRFRWLRIAPLLCTAGMSGFVLTRALMQMLRGTGKVSQHSNHNAARYNFSAKAAKTDLVVHISCCCDPMLPGVPKCLKTSAGDIW